MGIQPLGTNSGSILKLIVFPSFCTSSRKIPFASLFFMIFCFISYMYIQPKGKGRQPFGTRFWWKLWSLVACFKKYLCPLILCTFVHDFIYMYIALVGADKPLGPKFWCQHSTEYSPYHFGHLLQAASLKKNLFNLWFYTHLFMI